MDNTVAGTILEVSRQLNDQDASTALTKFVRWPKIDLLEYLNDGLIQIAGLRPDELITSGLLPTTPGFRQSLPSGIKELVSVDYALVGGCAGTVPLDRVDFRLVKTFHRDSCISSPLYRPYNWAYEATNPLTFYIYPGVPGGVNVLLQSTYRTEVPQFSDPDSTATLPFDNKYHGALVAWMQARAYEVDQESESSAKISAEQKLMFYTTMDRFTARDTELHAGTFLAPPTRRRR